MQRAVYIFNRKTQQFFKEKVPSEKSLLFYYGNPVGKALTFTLFARKYMSIFAGFHLNRSYSARKINGFIKNYQIDMEDYVVPTNGFRTFNQFFFRKLKPGKRNIEEGVVSPADGRVLVFPLISKTSHFFIKGLEFNLSDFLDNDDLVNKYQGGSMAIVRLAPVDYHRFHFSAKGKVSEIVKIKGKYYSVSPLALQSSLRNILENKREYTLIETETYGDILHCDVGATMTGKIIQTYKANQRVKKGEEKGYFAFGGSTIVLLFEKDQIDFSSDLIKNTASGFETLVDMGMQIASKK